MKDSNTISRLIDILSLSGVIEGGDELINALEQEPGEDVRLVSFPTVKEEFLIFTDPGLKRLIGCLSIQRDTSLEAI